MGNCHVTCIIECGGSEGKSRHHIPVGCNCSERKLAQDDTDVETDDVEVWRVRKSFNRKETVLSDVEQTDSLDQSRDHEYLVRTLSDASNLHAFARKTSNSCYRHSELSGAPNSPVIKLTMSEAYQRVHDKLQRLGDEKLTEECDIVATSDNILPNFTRSVRVVSSDSTQSTNSITQNQETTVGPGSRPRSHETSLVRSLGEEGHGHKEEVETEGGILTSTMGEADLDTDALLEAPTAPATPGAPSAPQTPTRNRPSRRMPFRLRLTRELSPQLPKRNRRKKRSGRRENEAQSDDEFTELARRHL